MAEVADLWMRTFVVFLLVEAQVVKRSKTALPVTESRIQSLSSAPEPGSLRNSLTLHRVRLYSQHSPSIGLAETAV